MTAILPSGTRNISARAVSDKVPPSVSDKASSPGRGNPEPDHAVVSRAANRATQARGAGKDDRKQLRFPTLRRHYARALVDEQTGEVVRPARSYYLDVWTYLQHWGYRTINDLQGDGFAPPSHAQLAALFEARVRERGQTWSLHDGAGIGLDLGTVETMADLAATAALRDWSEEWISQRREAGRKGGSISRKPATWDTDDLAVLALFARLPSRDAFLQYNAWRSKPRSRATLYRMRRHLREQSRTET